MSRFKAVDDADSSVVDDESAQLDVEVDHEIDGGQFVSNVRVVEWLQSWGKPNELPCPKPARR